MIGDTDLPIRRAAFAWLTEQRARFGEALSRRTLEHEFVLGGKPVGLVGPSGIWKPSICQLPISATTVFNSTYADRILEPTGTLDYAYRREGPAHHQNRWLSQVRVRRIPIIYFHAIEEGQYVSAYPVFVVGEDPVAQFFQLQVDDAGVVVEPIEARRVAEENAAPRREYVTRTFKYRVHQEAFRERILRAYHERCALCRLGHRPLLDAAHITGDAEPEGEPVVSNGLALCKLHHVAFDQFFFTVRPDYRIEVRPSILAESDGPMLTVGLQQIEGQTIQLPARSVQYPDRDRLARRYQAFKQAS